MVTSRKGHRRPVPEAHFRPRLYSLPLQLSGADLAVRDIAISTANNSGVSNENIDNV